MRGLEMPPAAKAPNAPKVVKKAESQETKEFAFHNALKLYATGFETKDKPNDVAERLLQEAEAHNQKYVLPTIISHIQKVLVPQHYKELLRERDLNPNTMHEFVGELVAKGLRTDEAGIKDAGAIIAGIISMDAAELVDFELAKYEKKV